MEENKTVAKGSFDLIKGDFSPEEALELVNDLFFRKINFNELKNFSQQIRFGEKDSKILDRINELKVSREAASDLIAEAKAAGKALRVKSTITIEIL